MVAVVNGEGTAKLHQDRLSVLCYICLCVWVQGRFSRANAMSRYEYLRLISPEHQKRKFTRESHPEFGLIFKPSHQE